MTKKDYYSLPTIRAIRRKLRKTLKKSNFLTGCKASISLYDENNSNILKTRRIKGRLRTK